MALQSFERYTCIGFDNSSTKAQMTTYNSTMIKKMDKLCKDFPSEFKMVSEQYDNGKLEGKEYEFNKKYVTIRQPTKRKMTEEQKKAAAERLEKARVKAEKKAKSNTDGKSENK